jgi:hypothetical protein
MDRIARRRTQGHSRRLSVCDFVSYQLYGWVESGRSAQSDGVQHEIDDMGPPFGYCRN